MADLGKEYVLENDELRAVLVTRTFGLNVTHKTTGQQWTMTDETFDEVVLEVDGAICMETLAGCRNTRIRELGRSLLCEFPDYRLQLLIAIDQDSLHLEFIPLEETDRFKIKGLCYPRAFKLGRGHDEYLLLNDRLLRGDTNEDNLQSYDMCQFGDEERAAALSELLPEYDNNWWSTTRAGYGSSLGLPFFMGWWGAKGTQGAMMAVLGAESRHQAFFNYKHTKKDGTHYRFFWLPSMGKLAYPRNLTFHFVKGGYLEMAQRYRAEAEDRGYCVTLRDKLEITPRLEKVIGAPVLFFPCFLHHDERNFTHEVVLTFKRAAELTEEFKKKTGFEKAHVHVRAWQRRGHDIHYPEMLPPHRSIGGPEGLTDLAERTHALGYAFGLGGDNYADVSSESPLYDESLRLIMANGKARRKNTWASGLTEDFCTRMALPYVRKNFEVGATGFNHCQGYLKLTDLDIYWIGNFYYGKECYDPRHPMTANQCRGYQQEIFQYVNDKNVMVFIEGNCDEVYKYFYTTRVPTAGPGRVPITSLVYHDCINMNGVAGKREGMLLHHLLNGTATHMLAEDMHNAEYVEHVQNSCRLHTSVAHETMTAHEFLSEDETVQRAEYANGVNVTVDFSKKIYIIEGVEGIDEKEHIASSD